MTLICAVCQEKFEENLFKSHPYKAHKIKLEDYFYKYYNRRDKFTNERIPFKSISQYLNSDFINKNNLRAWMKFKKNDEIKAYCDHWLAHRKEEKNLRYPPSQVELRTLVFPSISYLDEVYHQENGYYKACEQMGFFLRHERISKNTVLKYNFEYNQNLSIIKDTREGKPLIFSCNSKVDTLNWGDYALNDENLSSKVRVERKSLNDFIGTLSKNYERFCREIERAEKDGGYIVVLIEENFNNFLSFNFLPHMSKKIRATPEFISHKLRELCQAYDNVQFLFTDGRKEAARIAMKIFQLGAQCKNLDLQLAYDLRILS